MPTFITRIFLFSIAFLPIVFQSLAQESNTIAFVGRGEKNTRDLAWYDKFCLNSIKLLIEDLNQEYDQNLKVKSYSVRQDPAVSDSVYHYLVGSPEVVLVIDNSWGKHMIGARERIRSSGIPVVNINGTKDHPDFGDRVMYTINWELDVKKIISYTKKVLKQDTVLFVSETDDVFHNYFLNHMEKGQLGIEQEFFYEGLVPFTGADSLALFQGLEQYFDKNGNNQKTVLLNAHLYWGNDIMAYLNNRLEGSRILTWMYPQKRVTSSIKNENEMILLNKSDLAMSTSVRELIKKLIEIDPKIAQFKGSVAVVDNLKDLFDLLTPAFLKAQNTRESMGNFISNMVGNRATTKTEMFQFNDANILMTSSKEFTIYADGGESLSLYQINKDLERVPVISYGVNIISMNEIDLNANSFQANFDYSLTGIIQPNGTIDPIRIENMIVGGSEIRQTSTFKSDSLFQSRYSVSGKFDNTYRNADYPFDKQELIIETVLSDQSGGYQKISISSESFENRIEDIKISGWINEDYFLTVDNSVHGNPFTKEQTVDQSLQVHLLVKRNIWSALLQIVLPLFFIGVISIGILYLDKLIFSDLGEVIVGLFLAVIAFSISLSQLSPSFDVITKADVFFLTTFLTVFFNFLFIIGLNSKFKSLLSPLTKGVRVASSILYPIVFLVIYLY